MNILYSPQRSDNNISYTFNGETITCEYEGQADTFDFSTVPDGEVSRDENGKLEIETTLSLLPILEAKRELGVLNVTLLYFCGIDASETERFPTWQEV